MTALMEQIRSAEDSTLMGNAKLRALRIAGVNIGTFSSDVLNYAATVDRSIETVRVTALPTATDARVAITTPDGRRLYEKYQYGRYPHGQAKIALTEGSTTIDVDVSSPDKSATATYTVTVVRGDVPATGEPAVLGKTHEDSTLRADTSSIVDENGLANTTFTYQWIRNDGTNDTDIVGATDSTYTLVSEDMGKTLKVRVNFADDAGNHESLTSQAAGPVTAKPNSPATGQPIIVGNVQVGETLTADTSGITDEDGLTSAVFKYEWLANDAVIAGANDSSYIISDSDRERAVRVRVSFTDDRGFDERLTSNPVGAEYRPYELTALVQDGAVVLTWKRPVVFPYLYDYQVLRNRPELGETEPIVYVDTGTAETTYTDTDVEPGVLHVYRVKAANFFARLSKASEPVEIRTPARANNPSTGTPTISGTARVGETLTADTSGIADEDGLESVTYFYQWLADDLTKEKDPTNIRGANGSSYDLTVSEEGTAIMVQVYFADDSGNAETLRSEATALVEARANNPSTGAPTVSGTLRVGESLTADTSGIADEDGLTNPTYVYQWLTGDGASDADIVGATSLTYTLSDDDKGKTVKVRVSFTDDAGNEETLTSEATAAVGVAPEEVVWESELTVGRVPNVFPDALGYSISGDLGGTLSPDHFEIDGSVYSVQFLLHFADGLWLGIDRELPVEFTLLAGESIYEGSQSRAPVTGSGSGGYWWPSSISEWSEDESVQVSLSIQPQAPLGSREKAPLIANLRDIPSGHDGQTTFTFELRFSEEPEPDFSYKTLRDSAFTVTGGSVENARRLNKPSNIRWEITVRPDGKGEVAIILPATADCEAEGAICTEDGRMLFNRIELTVAGSDE